MMEAAASRLGLARFGHEMCLLVGLLALMFGVAAMYSHSLLDPAWSTSGASDTVHLHNWMGRLGALLSDAAYFGFGFSVWWLWVVAGFIWLRSAVRWVMGLGMWLPTLQQRLRFWLGLVLLLCASCALEWSRVYRLEDALPGHAGGVLGYIMGVGGMRWLGFTGSGVAGIVLMVLSLGWVFGFSWAMWRRTSVPGWIPPGSVCAHAVSRSAMPHRAVRPHASAPRMWSRASSRCTSR